MIKFNKIFLPNKTKFQILALGAQSKGSFCVVKDNAAYLSDSYGDLSELGNFELFKKDIKVLGAKLRFKPDIIACDLHPEYISTKYAHELVQGSRFTAQGIQHHEAHIASCIADNAIKGKVIGVAFDGTGFGSDGNIWGGEFFVGDLKGFKRAAHLEYIPMPGGEAAVREPWRMALSYLYKQGQTLFFSTRKKNGKKIVSVPVLLQMIDKKINSPLTSSMGRLFDAVSSLIGICDIAKYEGEAAIELEKILENAPEKDYYKFDIARKEDMFIIEPDFVIKGIIKDLSKKVPAGVISLKFHNTVCVMIKDVCRLLRKKYNIDRVCLSGGVFQNRYLNENVRFLLEKDKFKVYLHSKVPTHDGGIALGQAVIAESISR